MISSCKKYFHLFSKASNAASSAAAFRLPMVKRLELLHLNAREKKMVQLTLATKIHTQHN
jgi:hypothetical protein